MLLQTIFWRIFCSKAIKEFIYNSDASARAAAHIMLQKVRHKSTKLISLKKTFRLATSYSDHARLLSTIQFLQSYALICKTFKMPNISHILNILQKPLNWSAFKRWQGYYIPFWQNWKCNVMCPTLLMTYVKGFSNDST